MIQTSEHPPAVLDLSLFRWIASQTSETDRLALLSMKEAVCHTAGTYHYLEIGSHLGGSLQPHVADPRCRKIFSIDPRPLEQPDERGIGTYKYEGNSTERMFQLLRAIPNADLSKIETFKNRSWELAPGSICTPIDFAFVDGEHTNPAVYRDFEAVRRFLSPSAVLSFHDCLATPQAFLQIRRTLSRERRPHCFFWFPRSSVVALAFDSRLETDLIGRGWKRGLPFTRPRAFRLEIMRRYPRLRFALQGIRRVCSR